MKGKTPPKAKHGDWDRSTFVARDGKYVPLTAQQKKAMEKEAKAHEMSPTAKKAGGHSFTGM